jgi:hypothetical protein
MRRVLLFVLFVLIIAPIAGSGCGRNAPAPGSPTAADLNRLLASVTVVSTRPHVPGYDRDCDGGHGCVFGPAWTDDTDAPGGHNGCGTRNDVLAAQLTDVAYRTGANRCIVMSGTLADPYTGKRIRFVKRDAVAVQIDHVYPLAAAWDMGAARWPLAQRQRFANDVEYNLLAVDGKANQAKGDKTPADWLPPNRADHCFYVGKYLSAAQHYALPITRADRDAITTVIKHCR